jgi:hypothetical protein
MLILFSVQNNLDLIVETSSGGKRRDPTEAICSPLGLSKTTLAASRFQMAQADSFMEL